MIEQLLEKEILGRQEAEAALRDERDWKQRYLDAAEVILLVLDKGGWVTAANRYACDVLEWPLDRLLGRDWINTCVPARLRDDLRVKFLNLLDGDLTIIENPIVTRSGEERLIEWRNRVLRDDAGQLVGTLSCGSDITDRRRAEVEIREREAILQAERLRVLQVTMRTVQDIVNNSLNQLQLLRIEAEGHVSANTLALFDQTLRDTAAQLSALGNMETFAEKPMAVGPGLDSARSSSGGATTRTSPR